MRYPYDMKRIGEERYRDWLKEAEFNRMLRQAGAKQQDRFGLVNFLAGKMEKLLISARELDNRLERNAANHNRPSPNYI